MGVLRPASFWESFASFFSPKQVQVRVLTSPLTKGDFGIKPVFLIDDQEVPVDLLSADSTQTILGRRVRIDSAVKAVLQQTKGRPARVAKSRAADLLEGLAKQGVPVRSRDGTKPIGVKRAAPDVSLVLQPDDSLAVTSQLVTDEGLVIPKPTSLETLKSDGGWHAAHGDLVRIDLTDTPLDKLIIESGGESTVPSSETPHVLDYVQDHMEALGTVEKDPTLAQLSVVTPTPSQQVLVTGDATRIQVEPQMTLAGQQGWNQHYPEDAVEHLAESAGGFDRVPKGWLRIEPDAIEGFRAARDELDHKLSGRREFTGADIPRVLTMLDEASQRGVWQSPWNVYRSQEVQDAHRVCDAPANVDFRLNIVESDGRALLHLDPVYSHDRFKLPHAVVESALQRGDDWVRRGNAWVKIDKRRFERVEATARNLKLGRDQDGYLFAAARKDEILPVFSRLGSVDHTQSYMDFLTQLEDFKRIDNVPRPANLSGDVQLRSYQQHGLNWLAFLQKFGLNGILADDMGLGKTLQTIAAIELARERTGTLLPVLIVCPATVMFNWKAEVSKFLNRSAVVTYHGPARSRILARLHEDSAGVVSDGSSSLYVVTSYGTAQRDSGLLSEIEWLYVVIDEGHTIKNPRGKTSRAIKTIAGQHKLVLTGTPVQNRLDELWSLFDFAMPGYLGTLPSFQQAYGTKGKYNQEAVKTTLKPKIRPFVLRRLKTKVADLPPKLVVDRKVELTPRQVALYRQLLRSAEFRKMEEAIDRDGVQRAKAQVLGVYSRLQGLCGHPDLISDDQSTRGGFSYKDSGKLAHLHDLMREIITGRHRALLFSQRTQMLDIIERCFAAWKIRSLRIDGSTSPAKRAELVREYTESKHIHCFLLSTKAAGVGINLVSADTVIFYDHDWNPANDSQAADRAYRIGQSKTVTVYRLISKGTIEEKVLERQETKRQVAEDVIGEDAEGFKDVTKDELMSLFRLDEGGS
jgi:superfamily II DNA or RNA helicase